MPRAILALALYLGFAALLPMSAHACGCGLDPDLVTRALGADAETATAAREALRAEGPLAITFLDHEHIGRARLAAQDEAAWDALYDQIGQQRGCRNSHLFWYTDLTEAERVAAAEHKPILSLRMLGKLTDEYSCANSRFFRTVLYANAEVSEYLRDHVVLHWRSERPVPVVSVDFGDGRMIRTTVTGNSAHYILDETGRPLDALPGLYGPQPFLQHLREAVALDLAIHADQDHRDGILREHHATALRANAPSRAPDVTESVQVDSAREFTVEALVAEQVTVGKSLAESPFLRAARLGGDGGAAPMAPAVRAALADAHPEFGTIDASSRALVLAQMSLDGIPATQDGVIEELERSIAEDTVLNEFSLHAAIHRRFASGAVADLEALNRWMYDRLFRTPASDPWLGLMPHCYIGLDHNGVVVAAAKR